jgi:hypothetical protein
MMKKKMLTLLLVAAMMVVSMFPAAVAGAPAGENWIDASGNTSQPRDSRDVRNNTNGFGTTSYTPISYEGSVTLYAQNYGYANDDNYDIKLFILGAGGSSTQVGRLYGYGDDLRVEVFAGHRLTLVWQRHQMENRYYVVDLTGSFSTSYKKDFKGENTGYTSGNIYVKYNASSGHAQPPAATADITVSVNGAALSFDQPPIVENGRTLVPLRAIFEALGADVNWDAASQTVTAVKGNVTVTLKIGSNVLDKSGQQISLDVPAQIVGGRTLVPARAVAESFGANVAWDDVARTVTITG